MNGHAVDDSGVDDPAVDGPAVGSHVLADLHGIAPALLRDAVALERMLRAAAQAAGAHVLASHFHSFGANAGVTGVILLAESHISIHTWPELGFAAADIFMCGSSQPERALAELHTALAPARRDLHTFARGANRSSGVLIDPPPGPAKSADSKRTALIPARGGHCTS